MHSSLSRPIWRDTCIIGGFDEPFYDAPKMGMPAQIQFVHDHFRSALHELAHWCVAGKTRRALDDYGYWYAPDGRTQAEQEAFFNAEVNPQAIECAFSEKCGVPFDVSVDNLNNQVKGVDLFRSLVQNQLHNYRQQGFPKRAAQILIRLQNDSHLSTTCGVPVQTAAQDPLP